MDQNENSHRAWLDCLLQTGLEMNEKEIKYPPNRIWKDRKEGETRLENVAVFGDLHEVNRIPLVESGNQPLQEHIQVA